MNTMSKHFVLLSTLAAGLGLARVSSAAVYTVNNTNISGSGSLSLALSQAQSDPNATINITTGLGAIVLTSPLPPIENNLVINGNGNTISGAGSNRIFFVNAPNDTVQMNGLALLDGVAQGGHGGAGFGGGGGGAGLGGAIFLNAGSLAVNGVSFSTNSARGGAGGGGNDNGVNETTGGGGGGGGLSFGGGSAYGDSVDYEDYVGPGAGGGALTSAGASVNGDSPGGGSGGGVHGGLGGSLALEGGNAGSGGSPTLADGGGGGGGLSHGNGKGGAGGNGSDFGGGGGSGSSDNGDSAVAGNGGFGGGGGGGAYTDGGAGYPGGNGGFGGGGGSGGGGQNGGGNGGGGGFGAGKGGSGVTGGDGLGAGGAIFARLGSVLTIQDSSFNGDTVSGRPGGASGIGQSLFLGATVNYSVSGSNVLAETIGGGNDPDAEGDFIKTGAGTLVLTAAESYGGSTTVSAGTLEVVNNILPSTTISVASGAVLQYNYSGRILGATTTYTGGGTLRETGTGQVIFGPGVTYVQFSPGALIDVQAGVLYGSSSYGGIWTGNEASLNIASNALFDAVEAGGTGTMQIDALTGAGTFQGGYYGNENGLSTVTIGVAGGSGAFSGALRDDAGAHLAVVKAGSGTEILSGNNTYSGGTMLKDGALVIDGTTGAGTMTVTGGVLGGTGAIAGSVDIEAGGALAPGAPLGMLTISNTLNLAGSTRVSLSSGTNSQIAGLTSVTYGGTLTVTNLGGPLSPGETFTLFTAASSAGNFASIEGPAGNGQGFSFNPTNGILSVVSATPSLMCHAHSGAFTVNWPTNCTGWILQSQTNSGAQGLGTNWTDVPGSATVNALSFSIVSTNCVFFRLQPPAP
jgi:autotransporter-associated beta strand protein